MIRFFKTVRESAEKANWISAVMLLAMMLLTTADVLLRFFRHPIPGTYEIIGMLSSAVVSFSLGYTSVARGHIAVDLLVKRLSPGKQQLIEALNAAAASILFAVVTWQAVRHGIMLMQTGEVSLTVKLPVYPFAFGVAAGCTLLCIVLISDLVRALQVYREITEQ